MNIPEWSVQATIEEGLLYLGYIVLHTQHQYRMQTCPRCQHQFRPTGGYGASPGIADLLVRHPDWKVAEWRHIEVKGSKTPLSKEQKVLQAQRAIVVCRSWEEAKAALGIE